MARVECVCPRGWKVERNVVEGGGMVQINGGRNRDDIVSKFNFVVCVDPTWITFPRRTQPVIRPPHNLRAEGIPF